MATLDQLQGKMDVRDFLLAGLVEIILGERSAETLREALAAADAKIEGNR